MNQAKHSQVPQTARAAFNDAHQDGHNVVPQKYDEVHSPMLIKLFVTIR